MTELAFSQNYYLKFGETQTNFTTEQIYFAETDGVLYIQHNSVSNQLAIEVYTGDKSSELVKIGEVRWFGTITMPVERYKYWKVSYNTADCEQYVKDLSIRWTPVLPCDGEE